MNIYKYADAEQLSSFEFKVASENLAVYESIEQFNEKEAGLTTREPEEKLFGLRFLRWIFPPFSPLHLKNRGRLW